jgi:hypothetical protein
VQRELRDYFTQQAEELGRSVQDAVRRAESAAGSGEAERTRRIADLRAELERIAHLEQLGRGLLPEGELL